MYDESRGGGLFLSSYGAVSISNTNFTDNSAGPPSSHSFLRMRLVLIRPLAFWCRRQGFARRWGCVYGNERGRAQQRPLHRKQGPHSDASPLCQALWLAW